MNDMIDMSHFVEAKSDQLNADDLIGTTRTITVRRVTGNDGDQPVSIYYEGDNNKPFKPCKTMRRVLLAVWGKFANDYIGKSMTLYRDDKVTFGGLEVGGIRISHMSHIDKETVVVVMKTKGKKAGIKILPLKVERSVDKAAEGARALLERIKASDPASIGEITGDATIIKQRAWLAKNRPELAATIDAAIAEAEGDPWGAADEQRGESHAGEAQSLRDAIAAASDLAALDDLQERFAEAKKRLIGNDITAIRGLLADRRNELA